MITMLNKIGSLLLAALFIYSCTTKSKKSEEVSAKQPYNTDSATVLENRLQDNNLINQSMDRTNVPEQAYMVKAKEKKWITAKKGFKLFVDPTKLCKKDGSSVDGAVEVVIKEITNTEDMIAANTPTMSDGKMLISGGSYFVQIKNNGEELSLRNNQSLQVQLPNIQKNNMQLFYGDYAEDGFVNWKPSNKRFRQSSYGSSAYTRSSYGKQYYTNLIKIKDTLGKRPATLAECYKIYMDSTYNARWDYTREHRNEMTHKEKMAYGLRPFTFPYDRFRASLVRKLKPCYNCLESKKEVYYESTMYYVPDTVPVYKEDTVVIADDDDKTGTEIDYYEPVEITSLGWINCDAFYDVPICKSTQIQLGNKGKLTACRIYYNYKKLNSLLAEQLYFNDNKATEFTASTKLPIGEKVEIIVLAVQDGKLMTSKRTITIAQENKIAFELVEADKSKLKLFGKEKV